MPIWTKEQNEAIISDGENIIVSAGAGSGKTAVLSERVLRKLKEGINIDELLILTFTKAAAKEMKERIRKKIEKESSLKEQLIKLDNSYITTFDAFALLIVKKYNYVLNVAKNINIIDEGIIYMEKKQIIDEIFLKLYEEKDVHFLKLIDDFCTKDDEEIKNYILNIREKLEMKYDKEIFLANYEKNFYNDKFVEEKIQEYEKFLGKKVANITKLVDELSEFVPNEYMEKINLNLSELLISDTYEKIKSNLNTLTPLPKNSGDEAKEIKEKITTFLKELDNLCIYEDKNALKQSIYETKPYVLTIIKIIKLIDEEIKKYKQKNDLYEFNDIAKMAITIVKDNSAIRDELKLSFKEILIDEYQDTNDLQELFISYISNQNVYMVGDIKQSIYRFRNANPYLFKSKYEAYSKLNGGKKIDLNKNFRSREEVLNNINLIFNLIMDEIYGGADYQALHQMSFGNKTYNEIGKTSQDNNLEILNYFYDKKGDFTKEEIEIFIIANDIKNKIQNNYQIYDKDRDIIRPILYEDIVILMDRTTNFNLYKKIFEFLNIPLNVYKDEDVKDNGDMALIKNILGLFLFNKDTVEYKYFFVSVARSYLFRLSDEEIFKTVMLKNYEESFIEQIKSQININNLTCYELVEEIITKFNFYEKIITVGNINSHEAVLNYLEKLALDLTKIGYTIKDFYNYLETALKNNINITYSLDENTKGVKIMTIHKSKGLEYYLCYYSGLYAKFNISDLKEKFLFSDNYGIVSPYFKEGIHPNFYKDLLKDEYLKEEISEKIRLFYVALTRAREKMIMVAPFNDINETQLDNEVKAKFSSFLDILTSIFGNISKFIKNVDLNKLGLTKDYNIITENNFKDKIKFNDNKLEVIPLNIRNEITEEKHYSKAVLKLLSKEEINLMHLGSKIHQILANLNLLNPNLDNLSSFEKKKVLGFLNTGILKNVQNIYQEYEFLDSDEDYEYHGFIDLILEYEKEFKIVDYKLKNVLDEAYLKQLSGYKKYLSKITSKPIKLYLYSIIDEELTEIFL